MKKVYSRPKSLHNVPFYYCPGCGHSIIHRIIAELLDEMDLQGKTICVPPPGCAVLAYN
jgi:2-oxoglutarate ferredoxin oxidoreductase subunit beta